MFATASSSASRRLLSRRGFCLLLKNHHLAPTTTTTTRRDMSFNFAGAKSLNEIMKTELIQDKSKTEIADLWYSYHESKVSVVLYE